MVIATANLPVELTATVVPRPDEIEVHAALDAPDATLQGLVSLVPAAWRGQLADMTVAGDVVLAGTMDGVLASAEDRWPAFRMTAAVTDGSYKHASLPETVRDLGLDLVIRHAQGPLAAVDIEVNAAGFAVGTSSFEATGAVAQALGEPTIDFDIAADLDLVTLTKAVPVEGFSGRGRIQADVRAQGPLDAFTEPRAEELQVSGTASARDLRIDTALMPLPVDVASADVTFDPRTARVTGLAASFGESDVRGSASFDNLIGYMLGGSILVGNVDLVSDRLDLAPFMETPSSDPAAPGVVQLPRDLDLRGTFAGTEVRFDDWALTDVSGAVHADRGVLRVDGLELGVAGGRVRATGDYQALTADRADLSMDLAVSDLEAPAVLAQFTSVGDLFPAGLVPRGRFGGVVRLDGSLDGEMALIPASVRSNGSLQARGVVLEPGILQQAAQRLGRPEIRELRLGSGALGFVVDAGVLKFDPTAVRLGGFAATLDGSVGLVDRALRVTFATEIPTQGIADSELLGRFGSLVPKQVPVGLTLAGTTTAPSLSIELSEVQGLVKQAVKDQVDALRDRAEVAVDEARAAAIARAQDEAAKLLQQAERAAAKLRTAADRQGDALVAEADGNPLLKAAAKRASDKLIAEAERKAKELIQDARAQGNRGIEAAERVSL